MSRRATEFQTIRSEGGLLPPDLLRRVVDPAGKVPGVEATAYGLPEGERFNEAITQSWTRLRRHWSEFRAVTKSLPEGDAATGLTNDKWSLPLLRELGFGFLTTTAGPVIDGKTYAISRFAGPTAIHLVGSGVSLDRRAAGVRGAAQSNPHGLVQEFLNRSTGHLWAIVANGLRFRILRDNQALSRQSYLEFDLEAMLDGEVYSDFVLLWLVAHATRFLPRDDGRSESCWLEAWTKEAETQGTRALADLKGGVERALVIIGQGFVSHPKNGALRDALRTGQVSLSEFHRQLLRVVYRFIFLFVAEDRELDGISLLHPRDSSPAGLLARERFAAHYGTRRLRDLAQRIKGSRHGDLWRQLQLLVGALSGDERFAAARQSLALPALGSLLWSPAATAALNAPGCGDTPAAGTELANADFLEAVRNLAFTRQGKVLRPVDYKNLGSEELGGIYESFLALTPQISGDGARFTFAEFAGNERKTSGSYYTPDPLVQCLLDSALDPVVHARLADAERLAKSEWVAVEKEIHTDPVKRGYVHSHLAKLAGLPTVPATSDERRSLWESRPAATRHWLLAEHALLALKICDRAVGSGHFLVGAAHRLARHLARVRALADGESEPSPDRYQHALRDVIGRCLYGVDINPMAVELCKVTLWLEALEPGKTLSFLDHHIKVGNSLLGATPELIAQGIPDDAFIPIEGDDRKYCADFKKENRRELRQLSLFDREARPWERLGNLPAAYAELEAMRDDSVTDLHAKEARYGDLVRSGGYLNARFLHDAWCAAFVWKKRKPSQPGAHDGFDYPVTNEVLRKIERNPHDCPPWMREEIQRLARSYAFFHWHIEFPEVFAQGGFDVSLGNPPWERVKLQEKEWFAERRPDIAEAPNSAARKRLIEGLAQDDPTLHAAFGEAVRRAEGESHLLRDSGIYPLCGCGDINLYAVFAEAIRQHLAPAGRMGAVLPSGIATDDTTKLFFQAVSETRSLVSLFDFENRAALFPAVDSRMRFCLFTAGSGTIPAAEETEFLFFAHRPEELRNRDRRFRLSPEDIALLNPNTRTCPIFRSARDAELTKSIYRRVPIFRSESQRSGSDAEMWRATLFTMLHSAGAAHLFLDAAALSGRATRNGNQWISNESRFLPLYEGKMFHHFDHRFAGVVMTNNLARPAQPFDATNEQKRTADWLPTPRAWVLADEIASHCPDGSRTNWFLGYKDVGSATNERTLIATILPQVAIVDSVNLVDLPFRKPSDALCLLANFNSFAFDYIVRQKTGGLHIKFYLLNQLPVLPPATYAEPCAWAGQPAVTLRDWLLPRVLELTYTAWDLEPFARDCGWSGPPFVWDEARRFQLRCELDAAFFHLYGQNRDDTAYILDTFPIVRRKDEAAHGTYRTRDTILALYDQFAEASTSGQTFVSPLDPPPGDRNACHPARDHSPAEN